MSDVMAGLSQPQYANVVEALAPVLSGLPGKIIAVGGWPGVGKTTLGRFLAWRFNVALLETDLFLIRGQGKAVYRTNHITPVIDHRLACPRPIIVEGAVVLRLLSEVQRSPDFVIHVLNAQVSPSRTSLWADVRAYEAEFKPKDRADIIVSLEH